ncbi:MAG: preprotein translocase subunit SecG [Oscillospiraceae bacterium]|nr:preprotein translocase subunit SecG [Oscillospiraceae bacterium]MBQ2230304.1 preprotein translocase subunit SecG [Oscillospiraceae bacterium]MBQ2330266.1 preprotein translocase subunit SecG [Oscillospiraceae bacterium]MBQ3952440.1 preprotein translocase subunit SecG [Oscillospiraceae bacterium]MBQ5504560.1 preprotein translocase subunit SecG [Oscillospiraceae bacterium]
MGALEIVLTIVQLLACVAIVLVVLFQSGKSSGLSGAVFGGGNETFMSKNKGKSFDAKLARATKWLAALFVVLTLVLNFIVKK